MFRSEQGTVFRMEHKSFDLRVADSVRSVIASSGRSVRRTATEAAIAPTTLDRRLRGASFTINELRRISLVVGLPISSLLPDEEVRK